jgi:transposase-like protein
MQDATPLPPCPRCHATHVVRNGRLRSGSPQLLCRGCGRRFVPDPKRAPVTDDRKDLVRRLLRERMSLRGIARATGLSRSWLQAFVNTLYREDTPWDPGPLTPPPKKSRPRS